MTFHKSFKFFSLLAVFICCLSMFKANAETGSVAETIVQKDVTAHDPDNLPSLKDVEHPNDLQFPNSKWSTHLAHMLDKGPEHLDKDIVIDIPS